MEVSRYERHDVFAGTPSLKGFRMVGSKSSQSQSHRTRASQDRRNPGSCGCILSRMEDVIYAHPPAEAEPYRTVVWLLVKAHYGTRKAARLWQEFLRNEVFMQASWDAVAVGPNVYHKAGSLGDDDDACVCVHGDDFMVELRVDVFHGAQGRHQRDFNH